MTIRIDYRTEIDDNLVSSARSAVTTQENVEIGEGIEHTKQTLDKD